MEAKQALLDFIVRKIGQSVQDMSKDESNEIYVYTFFVYDFDDDPRFPTVTFGYNTVENYKDEAANASSEAEAKWNYAFWLQNSICEIGTEADEEGRSLVKTWIQSLGLYYEDYDEDECFEDDEDFDEEAFDKLLEENDKKGNEITCQFIQLLIEAVQILHQSNAVDCLVLIHELEYYREIAEQNIAANGAERVQEFVDWIESMYK